MSQPARACRPLCGILVCWVALLAACAVPALPSTANSTASGPAASSALTSRGIRLLVWGGAPQLEAYRALVGLYRQRDPGRVVELVSVPNSADYQKRLATDFAAGSPADIIVLSYLDVPGLASHGLLAPAAPYLAASQSLKATDFYSQALSPFIYDRQLQCLPQNVSGLVVYYNKTLFQQAGLQAPAPHWTWDQFLADARALTHAADGVSPTQYGLGLQPTLADVAPFIWQNRGVLVDDGLWPSGLALNTAPALTATTWLANLQTQYHVVPDAEAELAASSEQRFMDGSLAMLVNTRAGVPAYRQITAFDWDVAPLPENNGRGVNVLFADGYCLTAASTDKAAAWQFVEFASSPPGAAVLARTGAIVPALTSVAQSSVFLDPAAAPAHAQVFLDAVAQAKALPKLENWGDIQAIADQELGQAFYGQKDVAQALAAATARSEEYFKIHAAH